MDIFSKIDLTKVPDHIAIIMDGNGRWAKNKGQERLYGHSNGAESVREALRAAEKLNLKYLTLYTFSTENWNRPKAEIDGLMNLLVQTISNEIEELNAKGIRLLSIGDTAGLPTECRIELENAIKKTAHNSNFSLVLALNYSSRWEIKQTIQQIAKEAKLNTIQIEDINEEYIAQHLCTKDIPDPDLLIRTSGEHRISNFLLWQIAYTELHFTPVLWPDFTENDLYKAVFDYQSRERRFGLVSEQL